MAICSNLSQGICAKPALDLVVRKPKTSSWSVCKLTFEQADTGDGHYYSVFIHLATVCMNIFSVTYCMLKVNLNEKFGRTRHLIMHF